MEKRTFQGKNVLYYKLLIYRNVKLNIVKIVKNY